MHQLAVQKDRLAELVFIYFLLVKSRDCPINRTCRLIAYSTSDFDDRLQFYKIDYFEKINCISGLDVKASPVAPG